MSTRMQMTSAIGAIAATLAAHGAADAKVHRVYPAPPEKWTACATEALSSVGKLDALYTPGEFPVLSVDNKKASISYDAGNPDEPIRISTRFSDFELSKDGRTIGASRSSFGQIISTHSPKEQAAEAAEEAVELADSALSERVYNHFEACYAKDMADAGNNPTGSAIVTGQSSTNATDENKADGTSTNPDGRGTMDDVVVSANQTNTIDNGNHQTITGGISGAGGMTTAQNGKPDKANLVDNGPADKKEIYIYSPSQAQTEAYMGMRRLFLSTNSGITTRQFTEVLPDVTYLAEAKKRLPDLKVLPTRGNKVYLENIRPQPAF